MLFSILLQIITKNLQVNKIGNKTRNYREREKERKREREREREKKSKYEQ